MIIHNRIPQLEFGFADNYRGPSAKDVTGASRWFADYSARDWEKIYKGIDKIPSETIRAGRLETIATANAGSNFIKRGGVLSAQPLLSEFDMLEGSSVPGNVVLPPRKMAEGQLTDTLDYLRGKLDRGGINEGRFDWKLREAMEQAGHKVEPFPKALEKGFSELDKLRTWNKTTKAWEPSPQLKWYGKHIPQRAKLFARLDPRMFPEETLLKLPIPYKVGGGKIAEVATATEWYSPSIFDVAREKASERKWNVWDNSASYLDDVSMKGTKLAPYKSSRAYVQAAGISLEGPEAQAMDIIGGGKGNIVGVRGVESLKGKGPLKQMLPYSLAIHELDSRYTITPGRAEKLTSTMDATSFIKGEHVIGRSNPFMHILDDRGQSLAADEMYGQTRYLKSLKTGRMHVLGSRKIVGKVMFAQEAAATLERDLTKIANIARVDRVKGFLRARKLYEKLLKQKDPTSIAVAKTYLRPMMEETLDELGPRRINDFITRGAKGLGGSRKALKELVETSQFADDITKKAKGIEGMSKRSIQRLDVSGFLGVRGLVEGPETKIGERFLISGGDEAIVESLPTENALDKTSVLTKSGRAAKYSTLYNKWLKDVAAQETGGLYRPNWFDVKMVRTPSWRKGKFYRWETGVFTMEGKQIANIKNKFAKEFFPEVQEGLLPTKKIQAKIYKKLGRNPLIAISGEGFAKEGIWENVKQKARLTGGANFWENIKRISSGDANLSGRFPYKKFGATKYFTAHVGAGKVPKSRTGPLLVGAAIAAGAMLLWSAFRQRNRPQIDERDLPQSMYGQPVNVRRGEDGLPTHQPTTRISEPSQSSGYNYDVSVSAGGQKDIDYSRIAEAMAGTSKAALGVERTFTNLNISDDSSTMNPDLMQRRFVDYLRK